MEEELAAGLSERQIAQFVHDDEVEPGDEVGKPALLSAPRFGLQPIDEIHDIEEPAPCSIADQRSGKRDGQV